MYVNHAYLLTHACFYKHAYAWMTEVLKNRKKRIQNRSLESCRTVRKSLRVKYLGCPSCESAAGNRWLGLTQTKLMCAFLWWGYQQRVHRCEARVEGIRLGTKRSRTDILHRTKWAIFPGKPYTITMSREEMRRIQ